LRLDSHHKSGGYRTVIAYRQGDLAVFLLGFAKNERANIDDDELEDLRERNPSSRPSPHRPRRAGDMPSA
jgi:hypothetical protein